MPTVPIITFKHTSTDFIIIDSTGDYNAVTNTTGWGSPNTVRSAAVTLAGTAPNTTPNAIFVSPSGTSTTVALQSGNFADNVIRSQSVYSALGTSMSDGIWTVTTTYTGIAAFTTYTLRDASIKCALGKLALGDMTSNDYAELKMLYDKMVQAMECGEYVLAQEIYADIQDTLSGCAPSIRTSCGC
jgi:hypothetical protein